MRSPSPQKKHRKRPDFQKTFSQKSGREKGQTLRACCAECVWKMLDEGKSLSSLLPEYQHRLPVQDLPLLQEIVFGVARTLPRLEKILTLLVEKPLKGKTRIVHCLLLVGLYQLLYTRIPPFAVVDEMVNAVSQLNVPSFRGLVNAVLRRFLREQAHLLTTADKHWHSLHPDWFINLLKPEYPNWREIIDANNERPPMWLRVRKGICRENYQQALAKIGIESTKGTHPQSLCLATPCAVQKLVDFEKGAVSVQDLHAQWAGTLLEPKDGEHILDACSAPGGKTTHILELAPNAQVVALDIEANRLKRVQENLTRMGQKAEIICGDARYANQWGKGNAPIFDKILLDAPCSATGVIRRHSDIKWLRQEADIAELVALQKEILQTMWDCLKPNGILLYATCSVLPQENRLQIDAFLSQHPDAELLPLPFGDQGKTGQQFLPQNYGGDGFYYAKLRKRDIR